MTETVDRQRNCQKTENTSNLLTIPLNCPNYSVSSYFRTTISNSGPILYFSTEVGILFRC